MSKSKKFSLTGTEGLEMPNFKPKDLIWAKMKGFTPWPAMIVDPPIDLLTHPRKSIAKCVFFFGSRNFAWIEMNNLKPFEGPWKAEMAKATKPNSFKFALQDIENYIKDPTDVDTAIAKNSIKNHASVADFDKVRDGLQSEDEGETNNTPAGGAIEDEIIVPTSKVQKRAPKVKSSAAVKTKSTPVAKFATKQRRSSGNAGSGAKRKRNASAGLEELNEYFKTTPSRRKISTDPLAQISSSSRRNMNSIALLDRPIVSRPETLAIDMNVRSQTLVERDITPSNLVFGFLGLGIMGSTIVKDLICTGHNVVVWNRTMSKCRPFQEAGAKVKATPMDVVEVCDVIFCCVSDPKASKDLVFGNCGVLQYKDLCNKSYVEMSTIDPETSQDIAEGITHANGRYLEVQIHGTRQEAEDGMLIILAGGDRKVFEECHSCFKTIAKNTFFLGEVGNACKVNLILQTIVGVSLVGLAEALALADRFSISLKDIIDIFELTSMKSELLLAKGKEMAKGEFNPQQPLSHMQKDLRLVLSMAENLDQSMPVTAITNEVFKHTKRLGYSDHDSSAVFESCRNQDTVKLSQEELDNIRRQEILKEQDQIKQIHTAHKHSSAKAKARQRKAGAKVVVVGAEEEDQDNVPSCSYQAQKSIGRTERVKVVKEEVKTASSADVGQKPKTRRVKEKKKTEAKVERNKKQSRRRKRH